MNQVKLEVRELEEGDTKEKTERRKRLNEDQMEMPRGYNVGFSNWKRHYIMM